MINYNELTLIVLAIAFTATLGGMVIARRGRLMLRPIQAYTVLPDSAADAVESDHRLHFSMGSSGVGRSSTISALAAAEVIYRLAERLAVSHQLPLVTLSDPMALPLAQDTLRRAYEYRRRVARYRSHAVAWFPQGTHSLAFAAGAASLAADADVHGSVLLGRFGYEMAYFGESATRHDQALTAHSDLPEGQAIAWVMADQALLGEELYAGAAYMGGKPVEQGGIVAMDVLRWLIILVILVAALQAAL